MPERQNTIQPAQRIEAFKPYFFHTLNQKIAALQTKNKDVIRLDMGSPDMPPAPFIIEALMQSAQQADSHGYAPYGGTGAFRKAAADYYQKRFSVSLDPEEELVGLIGSKEGIFNLTQAVVNPGDYVLIPDPGYPTYQASALIAGAKVHIMPLLEKNGFLPDLDQITQEVASKARMLWINYPNNPTGAVAELEDFERIIQFCSHHGIIIAHDAPYMDVRYDGYKPPSIIEVKGAKGTVVEFNSLSKTYNMAGWRLGTAAGNPDCIRHLNTYKTLTDSSSFKPLLAAGAAALSGSQDWIEERNLVYQKRRDLVLEGMNKLGFTALKPRASLYIWVKLPEGEHDSMAFCDRMLEESGVSTTPGKVFGQYGEGYLRISLCTSESRIEEALDRLKRWNQ